MTLGDISRAMGAMVTPGVEDLPDGVMQATPARVSIDSRTTQMGDLFFCIEGERFDGHVFAPEAVRRGAVGVVATRPTIGGEDGLGGTPLLLVDDSVAALGRLAGVHRRRAASRVIGVTGSAGKTTVKEMLASLLTHEGEVAKNHMNRNNQIGLPLSMLAATGLERHWVMEAGISQPGDMDELASVLTPDIGLVLNVGPAHLEGLGSVRGVAKEKTRLLGHLAGDGRAVINLDYPELVEEARAIRKDFIGFTSAEEQHGEALVACRYLGPAEGGGATADGDFFLRIDGDVRSLTLPWRGRFAAENIAAVACVAHVAGMDTDVIAGAIAAHVVAEQRFQCVRVGQFLVIDDSYNANPLSMRTSLEAARELAGDRPLVLVLGEMRELGSTADAAHLDLGQMAAKVRPEAVYWRGDFAEEVGQGLRVGGWHRAITTLRSPQEFLGSWVSLGLTDAVVLVKGSRSSRMEDYVSVLKEACRDAL